VNFERDRSEHAGQDARHATGSDIKGRLPERLSALQCVSVGPEWEWIDQQLQQFQAEMHALVYETGKPGAGFPSQSVVALVNTAPLGTVSAWEQ
jgi:hypothetical protein